VIGALRLNPGGGPTGRDIIGATVVVEELSVDPAHQRAGVGTGLMNAAESWVRARPDLPQRLSLGVDPGNLGAIRLYQRLGYAVAIDNGRFLVMVKRLPPAGSHV
jgi:ribosomal protein S18 acetylase RimI-like enzyme